MAATDRAQPVDEATTKGLRGFLERREKGRAFDEAFIEAGAPTPPKGFVPRKDQPVLAHFVDSSWYEAKVVAVMPKDGKVRVAWSGERWDERDIALNAVVPLPKSPATVQAKRYCIARSEAGKRWTPVQVVAVSGDEAEVRDRLGKKTQGSPQRPRAARAQARPRRGMSVVVARGLEKRYGDFVAVRGIDFSIAPGEFFGFLGPNGAGKTSTMRMLQAVAHPTAGTLEVLGHDPVRDGKAVRQRIGVCPQEDNLDPDLKVRDNLLVYARYFGIPQAKARRRADELLELMQLEEKADVNVYALSGGMKRRLTIARSLINEPEMVLLDEPSTGLDPQARHLIWQKLRLLRESGVTLILTTHYMDEAERLCDRLVIMDRGRILAEGAPAALVAEHVGREVVEVTLPEERQDALFVDLPPEVHRVRAGDQCVFFFRQEEPAMDALLHRARDLGLRCLLRRAGLEDVFLELTGRELQE